MADRPILFSGPMVRALLEGRKTQTRRVLKPQFPEWVNRAGFTMFTPPGMVSGRGTYVDEAGVDHGPGEKFIRLPYAVGDRLWVRERARCVAVRDGEIKVRYEADGHEPDVWLPFPDRLQFTPAVGKCLSMGCYREASRINLPNLTTVRVQRVQAITAEDAVAEGIGAVPEAFHDGGPCPVSDPDCLGGEGECHDACRPVDVRTAFSRLWDGLNAKRGFGWKRNPWVVALGFTVARENIDQLQ